MATSKGIAMEIKLYQQQTQALLAAHLWLMDHYEVENEHEAVIHAYLQVVYLQLAQKNSLYGLQGANSKKFWKLVLMPHEAILFCQMWKDAMPEHPLEQVVLLDVIKKIDQRVVNTLAISSNQ